MSGKSGAKIGSAPKLALSLLVLIAGIFLAGWLADGGRPHAVVKLPGGERIIAEVANTEAQREKGLSGRPPIDVSHGMLFMFDSPGPYCFWMKDMRFDLDILWLDGSKKVIDLVQYLSPQTYPQTFCPKHLAKYVLEIRAGTAEQDNLKVGSQLNF